MFGEAGSGSGGEAAGVALRSSNAAESGLLRTEEVTTIYFIKPEISVIICKHNARRDYLDRVLEAFRGRNFSMER